MNVSSSPWEFPSHLKGKKIIAAVSGGLDSMVLACWLQQSGAAFAVAHCNFGLRGAESDGDEQLVSQWATANGVPCYVKHFNMPALLESGGNLQEMARDLRYAWFEELRLQLRYDLVATAHHKQDSVETMLINFFKGTGISGMHGILPRHGKIIRPLLAFSKEQLEQYAGMHAVSWREDSSNQKDDYTRNEIRHKVLPLLETLFPNVVQNLAANTLRFSEAALLYKEAVTKHISGLMEQRGKEWYIPVRKLTQATAFSTLLWEMLQPFGFSSRQMPDICHLLEAGSGRYVSSATHRVIRNRDFLVVASLRENESAFILIEEDDKDVLFDGRELKIRKAMHKPEYMDAIRRMSVNEICIDADRVSFPLVLRPWKQGDYFYPLGKEPKKKKISRYLIGEKVPLHEKEKVWVLECERRIVWVVGYRPDDRFRIGNNSVKSIYISVKAAAEKGRGGHREI